MLGLGPSKVTVWLGSGRLVGLAFGLAVLLEVLVSSSIFDELRGAGQHVRVRVESDWLNDIGGEEVHEGLDFVHL